MDTHFDVAIFGTGLVESITAAALSRTGLRVLHLDTNAYYGSDDASLTLEELASWADERRQNPEDADAGADTDTASSNTTPYLRAQRRRFKHISRTPNLPPHSRQFQTSLAPSVIPSNGPFIDALIASGVSRYGGFKLLDRVALYAHPAHTKLVPGNKEDVFKSRDMSLVEKRRLMKFLLFAAGEFESSGEVVGKEDVPFRTFLKDRYSLDGELAQAVMFALAYCPSAEDPTLPALKRIHRYLLSAGRYGASPFLLGHYGSSGELAQGFCRICAVSGGTYILGRPLVSLTQISSSPDDDDEGSGQPRYRIEMEDVPDILTADMVITSPDFLPKDLALAADTQAANEDPREGVTTLLRCVAAIDKPIAFAQTSPSPPPPPSPPPSGSTEEGSASTSESSTDALDTGILVFPPASLPGGSTEFAATVLVTGEASKATPEGKWLVYISLPTTDTTTPAETLLQPYLSAILSLRPPLSSTEQEEQEEEPTKPLFTLFYSQTFPRPHVSAQPSNTAELVISAPKSVLVTSPPSTLLPEASDDATLQAERLFWDAVAYVRTLPGGAEKLSDVEEFWPPREAGDEDVEDDD